MKRNYDINAVLNRYTDAERTIIRDTIAFYALVGVGGVPSTETEFIEFCNSAIESSARAKAKRESDTAKSAIKEARKALAMGLTVEQFRDYEKTKRAISSRKSRIRKAQEEIAKLQEDVERMNRQMEQLEKQLEKIAG